MEIKNEEVVESLEDLNLQHFEFSIPYADDGLNHWEAYKVNSENEFNMLMQYIPYFYGDVRGAQKYMGAGWYMVQTHMDRYWAAVIPLSAVIRKFTDMIADISDQTMDFQEA